MTKSKNTETPTARSSSGQGTVGNRFVELARSVVSGIGKGTVMFALAGLISFAVMASPAGPNILSSIFGGAENISNVVNNQTQAQNASVTEVNDNREVTGNNVRVTDASVFSLINPASAAEDDGKSSTPSIPPTSLVPDTKDETAKSTPSTSSVPGIKNETPKVEYRPTMIKKVISWFGSKDVTIGGVSDRADPQILWDQAKDSLLEFRSIAYALSERLPWKSDLTRQEQRKELWTQGLDALNDAVGPIDAGWDLGVSMTQTVADLKSTDEALQATVDEVMAMSKDLESRFDGVVYDKYGSQGLDLIVRINTTERSVGLYDSDTGEELQLRAIFDKHATFFEKVHQGQISKKLVVVTDKDRHFCIFAMDLSSMAPMSPSKNTMEYHVKSNVATQCGLGKRGVASWIKRAMPKTPSDVLAGLITN